MRLPPPPRDLLAGAALFLDFDGTLVELAEAPDAIRLPDGLPDLLARLCAALGGRLAIVTGRASDDLRRHLDCAGLFVAGSHGAELRRADGTATELFGSGLSASLFEAADAFAAAHPGTLVERKPAGLALHFRQAPGAEPAVVALAERLAAASGLAVQHGKCVVELRPAGIDKGLALRRLMAEPPFAGARPVFVGDDLTDEHGFEAAAALGGGGVLVGAPRATAALWRLADVSAVAAWLEQAAL